MKLKIYIVILLYVLIGACGPSGGNDDISECIDITAEKDNVKKSAHALFYNMFLPCEMVYLFEETGITYQPELTNPPGNISKYTTNYKKAINLGIYGVDMGYIKIYNQLQEAKEYAATINKISNELGIPQEHITYAMDYLDKHVGNIDSLYSMSCELFDITDSYLNRTERQSTSALIILGGWIEALYITTNMVEEGKIKKEIMDRIARQKYSLNSIISLLRMSEDNLLITNYLMMLSKLKKTYNKIDIYFDNENEIDIDTINKRINTENATTNITPEQFIEIKNIISRIRQKMVE